MKRRAFLKQAAAVAGSTALSGVQAQVERKAYPVPTVEREEIVYGFTPANNGAGPMWCSGSTCLVRVGKQVFASGLETIPNVSPLNNCRWKIYRRESEGWRIWFEDTVGRTREPAPTAAFKDGPLFLSANPTLKRDPEPRGGPAQPQLIEFNVAERSPNPRRHLPRWSGVPPFTEHSYRSLAVDAANRELILFHNIGYTHSEWAFRDATGRWSVSGQLLWPWGAEYEKPQPIRVCYPNVALHDSSVHFCGVSDIVEPRKEWREFKRQLTGREWDYDFRRLFYTWSPSIKSKGFQNWIELASCEETAGTITPGDLWVAPDKTVHVVWTEKKIDERLRPRFFPNALQAYALQYAVLRGARVVLRKTIAAADENSRSAVPRFARFHICPPGRLFVVWYASPIQKNAQVSSENRIVEIRGGELLYEPRRISFSRPFVSFFTTTVRGGSPTSRILEVLGQQETRGPTISYASVSIA